MTRLDSSSKPGLQQRELQLLTATAALALEEGRADRHRRGDARRAVDDGRGLLRQRHPVLVDLPLGRHQTAVRLRHDVRAGACRIRAGLAEAGDARVDQVRPRLAQARVVDAQPLGHAVAVVAQHDVEVRHDPPHEVTRTIGLEVDREAALAAVERLEVLTFVRDYRGGVAPILAARRLDLDHRRTQIGEVHPGHRPGDDLRELEHTDAAQRPRGLARRPLRSVPIVCHS